MDKEVFRHILKKYLEGTASEEEKEMIDLWYNKMENDETPFSGEAEELQAEDHYWWRINAYIKKTKKVNIHLWRWYSIGLAASALLILVSYLNFNSDSKRFPISDETQQPLTFEKITNEELKPQLINLPDGSEVILEPKSRIRYAANFLGSERRVYLDGKAFFKVVHDKSRPFKVITREVITKVLGTSFTVSAFRWDKDVTVSVVTGKVSVYKKDQDPQKTNATEVILTPNQEFVYIKDEGKIRKTIVREPMAILPPEEVKRMRFEDTPPKTVFEAIERVYGVELVYDEEKFSSCRITTNISDGNILNRLLIICEVINATYRIDGTDIIIEGEGCNGTL